MTVNVPDVMPITGSGGKAAARLCNFVTAKAFLLPAHIQFLDVNVATAIRTFQKPWVELRGFASRVGNADFNQRLSEQRIASVKSRITQYANDVKFQVLAGYGESQSGNREKDNSGYYRAVEVLVFGSRPPPPPPQPVPSVVSRSFYCSDASTDIVNVLDRFFSFESPIKVYSVTDMVAKVIERLNIVPGTKIKDLIISGHGAAGFQAVGCGTEWDSTGAKSLQVDGGSSKLLGPAAGAMASLNGRFAAGGGVSLLGCQVARGGEGLQLLRVVSKTVGVYAQAAIAYQRPLIPGWEGDLYRCNGDACWIQEPGLISDW